MSRYIIKDALLRHNIDNELLAETLLHQTTLMFIEACALYLRSCGYNEASDFLIRDTEKTLQGIDSQEPDYLG